MKNLTLALSLLLSVLAFSSCARAGNGTALADKRVLWLGDSITQAGQYVTFVEYFLNKNFPALNYDIVSAGLSSETMSGLSEPGHPFPRPCVLTRIDRALAETKPALVIACYGMNDGIYLPQSPERMKAFQDGLAQVIAKVKAAGAQLILVTPPPYDVAPVKKDALSAADALAHKKGRYGDYDLVLADYAKYEATLPKPGVSQIIDLHTAMNAEVARRRAATPDAANFSFTKDGIHPGEEGHFFMARTILAALGAPVSQNATLDAVKADPLYALVKKHRETRSKGWLAYIGYVREKTVRADSVAGTEKTAAQIQSEIDALRRK